MAHVRRVVRECVGDTLTPRRRGRWRRTIRSSFGAASPAGAVAILATCACAGPLVPMAQGVPGCARKCAVWCVEHSRAAPWGGGLAARGRPTPSSEHSVGQRRTPRARRFAPRVLTRTRPPKTMRALLVAVSGSQYRTFCIARGLKRNNYKLYCKGVKQRNN